MEHLYIKCAHVFEIWNTKVYEWKYNDKKEKRTENVKMYELNRFRCMKYKC